MQHYGLKNSIYLICHKHELEIKGRRFLGQDGPIGVQWIHVGAQLVCTVKLEIGPLNPSWEL